MSKDTRYLNLTELEHFSKEISDKLQGRLEYKTTLSLRPTGATERTDWNDIINLNNPSLVGDCYLLQGTGVGDFVEVNGVKYFHGEYIICTNVVDKDDTGTLSADVEIMKFGGSTADIDNKTILDHNDDGTYAQLHTRVGGWLDDSWVSSQTTQFILTDSADQYSFTNDKMYNTWGAKVPTKVTVTITERDTGNIIFDEEKNINNISEWEDSIIFVTSEVDFALFKTNTNGLFRVFLAHFTTGYNKLVEIAIKVDAGIIHYIDTDYIKINNTTIASEKVLSTDEVKTLRAKSALEVDSLSGITSPLTETIYRLTAEETISGKKYAKGLYVYDTTGADPVWLAVGGSEIDEKTILSTNDAGEIVPLHTEISGWKEEEKLVHTFTETFTLSTSPSSFNYSSTEIDALWKKKIPCRLIVEVVADGETTPITTVEKEFNSIDDYNQQIEVIQDGIIFYYNHYTSCSGSIRAKDSTHAGKTINLTIKFYNLPIHYAKTEYINIDGKSIKAVKNADEEIAHLETVVGGQIYSKEYKKITDAEYTSKTYYITDNELNITLSGYDGYLINPNVFYMGETNLYSSAMIRTKFTITNPDSTKINYDITFNKPNIIDNAFMRLYADTREFYTSYEHGDIHQASDCYVETYPTATMIKFKKNPSYKTKFPVSTGAIITIDFVEVYRLFYKPIDASLIRVDEDTLHYDYSSGKLQSSAIVPVFSLPGTTTVKHDVIYQLLKQDTTNKRMPGLYIWDMTDQLSPVWRRIDSSDGGYILKKNKYNSATCNSISSYGTNGFMFDVNIPGSSEYWNTGIYKGCASAKMQFSVTDGDTVDVYRLNWFFSPENDYFADMYLKLDGYTGKDGGIYAKIYRAPTADHLTGNFFFPNTKTYSSSATVNILSFELGEASFAKSEAALIPTDNATTFIDYINGVLRSRAIVTSYTLPSIVNSFIGTIYHTLETTIVEGILYEPGYYVIDDSNQMAPTWKKFGGCDSDEKTILSIGDDGLSVPLHTQIGGWKEGNVCCHRMRQNSPSVDNEWKFDDSKMVSMWNNKTYPVKVNFKMTDKFNEKIHVNYTKEINTADDWPDIFQTSESDWTIKLSKTGGDSLEFVYDYYGTGVRYWDMYIEVCFDAGEIHSINTDYINIDNTSIIADIPLKQGETEESDVEATTLHALSAIKVSSLSGITKPLTQTIYRLTEDETFGSHTYYKGLYVYDNQTWISVGGSEFDEKTIRSTNDSEENVHAYTAVGGYKEKTERVLVEKNNWGTILSYYNDGKYVYTCDNFSNVLPLGKRNDEDWYLKFTLIGSDSSKICEDVEIEYNSYTGWFGTLGGDCFAYYEPKYSYGPTLTVVYKAAYTVNLTNINFKIYSKVKHTVSDAQYIPADNITTFISPKTLGEDPVLRVKHNYSLEEDTTYGLKTSIGGKAIGTVSASLSNRDTSAIGVVSGNNRYFDMYRNPDTLTDSVNEVYDITSVGKLIITRIYFKYTTSDEVEHVIDLSNLELKPTTSRTRERGINVKIGAYEGKTWYLHIEHHGRRFTIEDSGNQGIGWDDTHNKITNVNVQYKIDDFNYTIPVGVVPKDDVTIKSISNKLTTTIGGGDTVATTVIVNKTYSNVPMRTNNYRNYRCFIVNGSGVTPSTFTKDRTYFADIVITYSDGYVQNYLEVPYDLWSGGCIRRNNFNIHFYNDGRMFICASDFSRTLDATSIVFKLYTKNTRSFVNPKYIKSDGTIDYNNDINSLIVKHDASLITDTTNGLKTAFGAKYYPAASYQILYNITSAASYVNGSNTEYIMLRWGGCNIWNNDFAPYIHINNGAFNLVHGDVTENYIYTTATYDGMYGTWGYKYKLDVTDSRGKNFWWVIPASTGYEVVMFLTNQTEIDGNSVEITHVAPWCSWVLPETYIPGNAKALPIDNSTIILDENSKISTAVGGHYGAHHYIKEQIINIDSTLTFDKSVSPYVINNVPFARTIDASYFDNIKLEGLTLKPYLSDGSYHSGYHTLRSWSIEKNDAESLVINANVYNYNGWPESINCTIVVDKTNFNNTFTFKAAAGQYAKTKIWASFSGWSNDITLVDTKFMPVDNNSISLNTTSGLYEVKVDNTTVKLTDKQLYVPFGLSMHTVDDHVEVYNDGRTIINRQGGLRVNIDNDTLVYDETNSYIRTRTSYGTVLPTTGTDGDIFFLYS